MKLRGLSAAYSHQIQFGYMAGGVLVQIMVLSKIMAEILQNVWLQNLGEGSNFPTGKMFTPLFSSLLECTICKTHGKCRHMSFQNTEGKSSKNGETGIIIMLLLLSMLYARYKCNKCLIQML